MPTEEKEIKEQKPEEAGKMPEKSGDKKEGFCSSHNHTGKIVLIIAIVLVVLAGLAALKLSFGHTKRSGRFAMMQVEPRGTGRMMQRGFGTEQTSELGVSGTVTAINGDKLTVKTSSKDQTVDITDTTSVIKNNQIAAKGDLTVNDKVVVAGTSNSAGELVATLIRVQPS
jgi:hypothetical protein